jgi:hypothetical protein
VGVRVAGALIAVAAVVAALGVAAARPSAAQGPRVTVIGDSVASALQYDSGAVAVLSEGVDLNLQLAPCRRLEGESCPVDGVRPPNAIELIHSLGSGLGQTVIVAVGYNDYQDEYAAEIEDALAALKAEGVQHVLWATLRATDHSYLTMNDDIRAAAAKHPEMTVADWNLYSRSHPDWFVGDGPHLYGYGAHAMATLFHKALVQVGVAPPPVLIATAKLPEARRGKPYAARLAVRGGRPPYRWATAAPLPRGLILTGGRLVGIPGVAPGLYRLHLSVVDSAGQKAIRVIPLHVLG